MQRGTEYRMAVFNVYPLDTRVRMHVRYQTPGARNGALTVGVLLQCRRAASDSRVGNRNINIPAAPHRCIEDHAQTSGTADSIS